MSQPRYIFIVMSQNIVFGAYFDEYLADVHRKTILGATVVPCEVFNNLPDSVRDDLYIDEYSDAGDTPVVSIPFDDILPKDDK